MKVRSTKSACFELNLRAYVYLPFISGGMALYNLSERSLIRIYEYVVLPGAPGGHNDQTESAFLERRPACTCLAWRPDGRMFVSGHDDGSLVFWSIEDGDREFRIRRLSQVVHIFKTLPLLLDRPNYGKNSLNGEC